MDSRDSTDRPWSVPETGARSSARRGRKPYSTAARAPSESVPVRGATPCASGASPAHAHLQPFEAVEAMDALPVHVPAFPSQQCTDAARAEARARERDLANAHPQRRLILRATGTVPGRPTESCEPTRVLHTGAKGGHGPQPAEARQLPRANSGDSAFIMGVPVTAHS